MAKTIFAVFGLAFLALGILGLTGFVPMFTSDSNYVNFGEIALGAFGLLVGIYARQNTRYDQQTKNISRQTNDNTDPQRLGNEQLKKENDQERRENIKRQKHQNVQLRYKLELQKQYNEQMSNHTE